jgi:hypothetical protein
MRPISGFDCVLAMDTVASVSQRAIELNNDAVVCWQSGHVSKAAETFQVAMCTLRDKFRDGSTDATAEAPTVSEVKNGCGDCTADVARHDLALPALSQTPDEEGTVCSRHSVPVWVTQDTCFLACYNRAILLTPDASNYDDSIVPVVILYNLGLLHHAGGLERADDEVLGQASRLYRLALGLLQKNAISSRNVLLHLALLNNCAQIESHLVRMDQMMSFLERMDELLLTYDHDDQLLPIDQDDYTIFSMNVMFGEKTDFVVAPAA